ncbi:MAG: hypothetical protein RJB38_1420 [Pseudomonadota bacterium]|jgi:hypothetical protein
MLLSLCALPQPLQAAQGKNNAPRFRATAIVDLGSNLLAGEASAQSVSSSLLLIPSYQISETWSAGAIVAALKNLSGWREFSLFDPSVRVMHAPLSLNPYLSVSPSFWAVIPVSERSLRSETLVTAFRPVLRFSGNFSRLRGEFWKQVFVSHEVGLSKAFHVYRTSLGGAPNTSWRLSNWLNAGYSWSSKWSFSIDFIRNAGWSYEGQARHSFSLGETLSYQVTPACSLSVGHTNEGDVLRANGLSSNIQIFDSVGSRFFTSVLYSF